MTCIVGVLHEGRAYIGGDSAGVADLAITRRGDSKVFTVGPYVMGFTSSFRMGQLLRYSLKVTPPPARGVDRFMCTTFIDAVRKCLHVGGFAKDEDNVEEGGTFLVGVPGRLYCIDSDFQFGWSLDDYLSVGCGEEYALGSLHTTTGLAPKIRVKAALGAAAHHSAGVVGPFVIKATR